MHSESLPAIPEPFAWRSAGAFEWIECSTDGGHAAFTTRTGDPGYVPQPFACADQVHSNRILRWSQIPTESYGEPGGFLPKADGHVTSVAGLALKVRVADCLPLALVAPAAVATLHCGWRGVASGIVPRGVAALRVEGSVDADPEVKAFLGPAIGPCCYEVGPELAERFHQLGHGSSIVDAKRLDLAGVVRRDLIAAGVQPNSIFACNLCTACNPDLFFSYRRDGDPTGRQAGLAWLT